MCLVYQLSIILKGSSEDEGFAPKGLKLKLLQSDYRPDLILLDIMLPKMQGNELLDIIREDEKLKELKVIILTALNLASGDETRLSEKADDYLLKINTKPRDLVKRANEIVGKGKSE